MGDWNQFDGVIEIGLPTVEQCGENKDLVALVQKLGGVLKMRNRCRNKVKAQYEDWLENRARRRVFDLRTSMSQKEFAESLGAVTLCCAAGTLSWGGEAWESSLQQLPGIVKIVQLFANDLDATQVKQAEITESDILFLAHVDPPLQLNMVVRDILHSTPNFLSPPDRTKMEA